MLRHVNLFSQVCQCTITHREYSTPHGKASYTMLSHTKQTAICSVPPNTGARTLVRFHACCNACPRVGAFLIPPTVCHILPPTSPAALDCIHLLCLTKNKCIASIIYHPIGTRLSIHATRHINLLLTYITPKRQRNDTGGSAAASPSLLSSVLWLRLRGGQLQKKPLFPLHVQRKPS